MFSWLDKFKTTKEAEPQKESVKNQTTTAVVSQVEETRKKLKSLNEKTRIILNRYSADELSNFNVNLKGYPVDISLEEADLLSQRIYGADLKEEEKSLRKHTRLLIAKILVKEQKEVIISFEKINEKNGKQQEGTAELFDISLGGLSMISDIKLSSGQNLYIYFKLGQGKNVVEFFEKTQVRYVKGRKYGLQFVNPSKKLEEYIQDTFVSLAHSVNLK